MKTLITGGAGFIGSHIADRLLGEGHQVMILDDFSNGRKDFVHASARLAEADIRDAKQVDSVFASAKPEAVFHCAAMIDVRTSIKNPILDYEVNVAGGMNVLEACKKHGLKKLIFSSSGGAVYGDNQNLPIPETGPPAPISPYGASKAAFESFAYAYHHLYGISVINLRYPNVYGPRQGTVGEGGVIAVYCQRLIDKKPLIVFGSGKQTRDFIFVDDVVESNIAALKSKAKWGVYNVSTGKQTSVNTLAKKLIKISGVTVPIKRQEAISGEVLHNALDNSLIKKELGWMPKTPLEEGLGMTWEWFLEDNQ